MRGRRDACCDVRVGWCRFAKVHLQSVVRVPGSTSLDIYI